MSTQKKEYVVVQPPLEEYPVNRAGGKLTPLAGETIYKWDDNYWLAVMAIETNYSGNNPRRSVRGYRWKWERDREGNFRWMVDLKMNFNKRKQWEDFKAAADRMFDSLNS